MFLYLSVHTQKTRRSGSETKKRRSLSFDQPLIGVKVSLIMDGRTSDLHSHLIRKYIPANKRPLSEVLGKFTETIPVSLIHSCQLMLFLYAARPHPSSITAVFGHRDPNPSLGQKCAAHQQRHDTCPPPAISKGAEAWNVETGHWAITMQGMEQTWSRLHSTGHVC